MSCTGWTALNEVNLVFKQMVFGGKEENNVRTTRPFFLKVCVCSHKISVKLFVQGVKLICLAKYKINILTLTFNTSSWL